MSGDVTYQALERLSHMPSRSGTQGDRLAGQLYYDVYITGGSISGVTLSDVNISSPGIYNVLTYGAVGNGIADDLAAIQAAIDAAEAAGGGQVYVPAGTYLVSDELTVMASFVSIVGAGVGISIIKSSGNSNGTLIVGSQSTSNSGKTTFNCLRDLTFECPSGNTVVNVSVFGATRLMLERCDFYRGATVIQIRNADQTCILDCAYRATRASSVCVNMVQGSSDDVTTFYWSGGIVDQTGSNGIGVQFSDGAAGSANEFNNIFMCGLKLDGNQTSGTTGMKLIAGVRNLRLQNLEFKDWANYSFDAATALETAQNCKMSIDSCKMLGYSTSHPIAHVYASEQTSARTTILITSTQMTSATSAVLISNAGTKAPRIKLDFIESSTLTNWLESDDNTVSPNMAVGQVTLGASVTNNVGTNLAASSGASWEDHGTRSGSFLLYAQGNATVADGLTSIAVTFTTALNYTPSARDITIEKTNSAIAGQFWLTSISSTGFTLNVQTAPSGTTHTYQYKVKAS